jgi:hypothetical protein
MNKKTLIIFGIIAFFSLGIIITLIIYFSGKSDDKKTVCSSTGDCPEGLICNSDSECVCEPTITCKTGVCDCRGDGISCVGGICVADQDCNDNNECPPGLSCLSGRCDCSPSIECKEGVCDCVGGMVCADGKCVIDGKCGGDDNNCPDGLSCGFDDLCVCIPSNECKDGVCECPTGSDCILGKCETDGECVHSNDCPNDAWECGIDRKCYLRDRVNTMLKMGDGSRCGPANDFTRCANQGMCSQFGACGISSGHERKAFASYGGPTSKFFTIKEGNGLGCGPRSANTRCKGRDLCDINPDTENGTCFLPSPYPEKQEDVSDREKLFSAYAGTDSVMYSDYDDLPIAIDGKCGPGNGFARCRDKDYCNGIGICSDNRNTNSDFFSFRGENAR